MMGYRLNGWGSVPGRGQEIFLFSTASRLAYGPTQPVVHWVPGALLLGVKQPECDAYHSPPSSAKVAIDGTIPPLAHMSSWWCLIKHMVNFTF
jgi:hypothetical protein